MTMRFAERRPSGSAAQPLSKLDLVHSLSPNVAVGGTQFASMVRNVVSHYLQ